MTTLIIGGGWSGLASAITLINQGHSVHLIESAQQLGGRARNVQWQDKTVDNGQHLMIGAYDRMLAMMNLIGINTDNVFQRLPLDITIHDTQFKPLHLSAKGWLPWPLSLAWNVLNSAGFSGLIDITRLQNNIPQALKNKDISVRNWLILTKQSERLIKQLWEPLCLATLNTPIEQASAHILALVLQDSLGQKKSDADLLIPKLPLGDLFPRVAAEYIKGNGGQISLKTRAKEIIVQQNKVSGIVTDEGSKIFSDSIIVATTPSQCKELLTPHVKIQKFLEYPICTVYLHYPKQTRLPSPMLGMSGTVGQWVFDRSKQHPGLMAIVISGPGQHEKMSKQQLTQHISQEVHQLFPYLPKEAEKYFVIREKRATFASTVNIEQQRPDCQTAIHGLYLAGDFIANTYPATLEGAIRNGEKVIKVMLAAQEL